MAGAAVRLEVESRYPESGSVRITLGLSQSAAFPIHQRIPGWARGATAAVDGEIIPGVSGTFLTINRQWHDGDEILLTLPMTVEVRPSFHRAVTIARGPLRFAYAPAVQGEPAVDREQTLRAGEDFAVALVGHTDITAEMTQEGVLLHARAVPVPRWGMRGPSCDQPPIAMSGLDMSQAFDTVLVPYAKAPIRLAVLPVAE